MNSGWIVVGALWLVNYCRWIPVCELLSANYCRWITVGESSTVPDLRDLLEAPIAEAAVNTGISFVIRSCGKIIPKWVVNFNLAFLLFRSIFKHFFCPFFGHFVILFYPPFHCLPAEFISNLITADTGVCWISVCFQFWFFFVSGFCFKMFLLYVS